MSWHNWCKKIWAEYKPELILIPLIFALDRISKILTLDFLRPVESITLLPFFKLTYVENTGAAFGSFQNGNTGLAIGGFIVLFFLIKWRKDIVHMGALARYGVLFILGGAIGNLYDRIVLGYVVDYFEFIIWPVFNVADSFISIGAVLLFLALVKDSFKKHRLEGK